MENRYKYFFVAAFGGLVGLLLSFNAYAQHPSGNTGGGGSAGGGGSHSSAPAPSSSGSGGGGHVQYAAPAPSSPSRSASSQNYSRYSTPATASHPAIQSYNYNGHTYYQRSGSIQRPYYSGHQGANTGSGIVNSYRYQGSVYGHNHLPGYGGGVRGYLPGNAYYHYNQGYYNSYYLPELGFSIGYLPYGYYPFFWNDYQYFYSGGLFYQYDNDQYTVVEPPVGAEVKSLPDNAQSIVINGQQYYEVDGVYYEPITKDDGTKSYQVAGKDGELNTDDQNVDNGPPQSQIGDMVPNLPPNCRKIKINGEKLYLSEDGIYFKAVIDQNGNKAYKIVGLPEDDDQQQQ